MMALRALPPCQALHSSGVIQVVARRAHHCTLYDKITELPCMVTKYAVESNFQYCERGFVTFHDHFNVITHLISRNYHCPRIHPNYVKILLDTAMIYASLSQRGARGWSGPLGWGEGEDRNRGGRGSEEREVMGRYSWGDRNECL